MYSVSQNFHTAVLNEEAEERILLEFDDFFLNNDDISDQGGLRFTDNFNMDEELTFGGTPSNTIDVSIFNDNNYLDRNSFTGEIIPRIGVKIGTLPYSPIITNNNVGRWCQTAPKRIIETTTQGTYYVYFNGVALSSQPSGRVKAIWSHDDDLYCIVGNGTATHYVFNGTTYVKDNSYTTPAIMKDKWAVWASEERYVCMYKNIIQEFYKTDGTAKRWNQVSSSKWSSVASQKWSEVSTYHSDVWEYVPLGVYRFSKPNRTKNTIIELTARDRMDIFNVDVTAWWNSLTFPMTLQAIYDSLCSYLGIFTQSFLPNGGTSYDAPVELRQGEIVGINILQKIAEASGTIAKFNRDGELELKWFKPNSYNPSWWFDQQITEYIVSLVTGIVIRDKNVYYTGSIGNFYTIRENPFFINGSKSTYDMADTLLSIIRSTPGTYYPSNATLQSDWSVEAGDIITVNGIVMPIFTNTMQWNGIGMSTYENSGDELRPIDPSDVETAPSWSEDIPTKTSQLQNDSGYITYNDAPVRSVNSKLGNVILNAADVGALPDTTIIPPIPTATAPINITSNNISHNNSGVTAGTYDGGAVKNSGFYIPSITVDAKGHITSATDLGNQIPDNTSAVASIYGQLIQAYSWALALRQALNVALVLSAGLTSTTYSITEDTRSSYNYRSMFHVVDVMAFDATTYEPLIVDWTTDALYSTTTLTISIASTYEHDILCYPIITYNSTGH